MSDSSWVRRVARNAVLDNPMTSGDHPSNLLASPSAMNNERVASQEGRLVDTWGRIVKSLRISLTDRCNLRCIYCLPQGSDGFCNTANLLSFDDLVRVVRAACRLGIDHVRLTGGEPLVRPGVPELVRRLKLETGVREVALTTNGVLLERHVAALVKAGVDRLTVSVDSLQPNRFRAITGLGSIDDVWRGIQLAAQAGLRPLKINVLVLRGVNDDEIDGWVELTRDHDLAIRFLELMPIGQGGSVELSPKYVDLTAVCSRLRKEFALAPVESMSGNGPARYWRVPGALGVVGFITPISDGYCDTCSRFRLTATGELRPCLAHELSVPLADVIRAGDVAGIEAGFQRAGALKPAGHAWRRGGVTQLGMSRIGG